MLAADTRFLHWRDLQRSGVTDTETGRAICTLARGQGLGSPSSSSIRYFGASAIALGDVRAGGGIVERRWSLGSGATGRPTCLKNSSKPAGEQRHSSRAGRSETFRKTCGAWAGTLIVSPAVATALTPRNVNSISPSRMVNISSKSWRWGGGPPPSGMCVSISV